jgi:hypothetical protein
MYKLTLKRYIRSYSPVKSINIEGDILTNFLTTDVGSRALSWIDWLNDPEDKLASANLTILAKDPDCPEDILIGDIFDDGPFDEVPHFVIKKNNLIELLRKWDELYKQEVSYIILTIDDDQYVHIEGKASIEEM